MPCTESEETAASSSDWLVTPSALKASLITLVSVAIGADIRAVLTRRFGLRFSAPELAMTRILHLFGDSTGNYTCPSKWRMKKLRAIKRVEPQSSRRDKQVKRFVVLRFQKQFGLSL